VLPPLRPLPHRLRPPRAGCPGIYLPAAPAGFWLFVALLGIGGYLFVDEQSLMSQLPQALTISWALVLIYAVPVFLIVYRLDLFEREPTQLLIAALLWAASSPPAWRLKPTAPGSRS